MLKIVCALAIVAITSAADCPKGWTILFGSPAGNETCVQAFKQKMDYYSAEQFCNKYNGHLASMHNGFESNHIYTLSQEVDTQCQYWIGADRFNVDKNDLPFWSWIDQSFYSFTRWKAGFPLTDPSSSDCAYMETEYSNKWVNDGSCAEFNCFVCTTLKNQPTPCTPGVDCPTTVIQPITTPVATNPPVTVTNPPTSNLPVTDSTQTITPPTDKPTPTTPGTVSTPGSTTVYITTQPPVTISGPTIVVPQAEDC